MIKKKNDNREEESYEKRKDDRLESEDHDKKKKTVE